MKAGACKYNNLKLYNLNVIFSRTAKREDVFHILKSLILILSFCFDLDKFSSITTSVGWKKGCSLSPFLRHHMSVRDINRSSTIFRN